MNFKTLVTSNSFTVGSQEWRLERFAELRYAHPTLDHDQILEQVGEEETNELQAREERRIMEAE